MRGAGAGRQVSSMFSPTNRPIIFCIDSIAPLRSNTSGWMGCLRAKASSCRVRLADFWAASKIRSRFCRWGSLGSIRFSVNSENPMIAPSMLLKSWATPPASAPTASSFSDWWSLSFNRSRSSSDSLRSVMSVMVPMYPVICPFSSFSGVACPMTQAILPSGRRNR